jgi:hypothetical protein
MSQQLLRTTESNVTDDERATEEPRTLDDIIETYARD